MQNIKIVLTFITLFFVTNITVASSDNSSIPHTFTSGSTISSSEINNNFTHVTPYLVKSNGTPIGVYFINTLEENMGKVFFNGSYRAAVDLTGSLSELYVRQFKDSNCNEPIALGITPGIVGRIINSTLSTYGNNILYDYPHYIPVEATPLYNQSDENVTSYYQYEDYNDPPRCSQYTVNSYMVKNTYLMLPNDPNVTGIQNSYPTPITVGK